MSTAGDWLDLRSPAPPPELAANLRGDLSGRADPDEVPDVLTDAALARLREARRRPGRVRASAFHLMAADALVTYACEAALEAADPEGKLVEILERGSSP